MQFLLMATGECEKLHPLATANPSSLVPILNRPVMAYPLELVARAGAAEVLVALYQQSAAVEQYFGDGRRWNVQLAYLPQRQALGVAGTLSRLASRITETLVILPGDALLDLDLSAALAFHRAHGGAATIVTGGCPQHAHRSAPTATTAATPLTSTALCTLVARQTGAYILEPEVLTWLAAHTPDLPTGDLLPHFVGSYLAVHTYAATGYWNPLKSFDDLQAAQIAMLTSLCAPTLADGQPALRYPFQEGREVAPGIWVGTHTTIHPSAKLTAPLFIGADCRIGAATELGPETVLGGHTVVDQGATIQRSTVLHHTYVGRLVDVQRRIVAQNLMIDCTTGSALSVTDPFLLGKVTPKATPRLLRRVAERLLAGLLLLALLPFLLLFSLLILLTTGMPPLHQVLRIGVTAGLLQEATTPTALYLWRLRTRWPDQSYLPLGQWFEQWDGHRLPELWNVLCGELALVGVKPLTPAEAEHLVEEWQRVRDQMAAGFTGLWYCQTEIDPPFEVACMADSYQAATDSWGEAWRYLVRTPAAWWRMAGQRDYVSNRANPSEVQSQPVAQ
jgi:NDP-sugar pyrophosphorylase family protein/lipopolysaccharide/colanic/teichoic acid biosynthesis glycosyltransferase